MNREFLNFYEQELSLLWEQAADFAQTYPKLAERLGGLLEERADPMIGGLLEGAAFLAARVQLKLKHEFADFTVNYLDQIAPQLLAPTPSFLMAQARPNFGEPGLREGLAVGKGERIEATLREAQGDTSPTFSLVEPLTVWPFEVDLAEYAANPKALQSLMPHNAVECAASLRLRLDVRSAKRREDEPDDSEAKDKPELRVSACRVKTLRFYLDGPERDAEALYEQLFGHCRGLFFRILDDFGDPVVIPGDLDMLRPVGFSAEEALTPNDRRMFRGFDLLRDYFAFPRRFLGFELAGLERVVPRLATKKVDILFAFDEANATLPAAVRPRTFALYAAPAVNLFRKRLDRVPVRDDQFEYPVIADRNRRLDYEVHRILKVVAHAPGRAQPWSVEPLYSPGAGRAAGALCYTVRRLPRRLGEEERRRAPVSDYIGTDMFLTLGQRADPEALEEAAELGIEALCTNRHLAEHLPVGEGAVDFRLVEESGLELACIAGPTRPREPAMTAMVGKGSGTTTGDVAWRLISLLGLNHLSLVERGHGEGARALRETLALFADPNDGATEVKLRGVRTIEARPVTRRMRQGSGAAVARGLEITVTLEDKAFEGSGAFLFGAVLDRYFAEYVAINHFTQTVVRTIERKEIMRWPPRIGLRGVM